MQRLILKTINLFRFLPAQLIDHFTGTDKQMNTGMILVDLQKAFDILDHGVLLEKMKYFGFQTFVIKWFEFYLSNRKKFGLHR